MKITMKLHDMDKEMIEIISPERKIVWALIHADMVCLEDSDLHSRLVDGESVVVNLVADEEET